MLKESLIRLFQRDFDRLNEELVAYENQDDIWKKAEGINNSAGNLSLHLAGNLRHFIGAVLGETGYVRDREFEFNGRVSFEELIEQNRLAREEVVKSLNALSPRDLESTFPVEVGGNTMSTTFFLSHLYGHFNYHLGQINYHRRLLSGK